MRTKQVDKALLDLIRISREVGRDSSLVLGGGGNTSVKTADGRLMYVKASGTALKDMSAERGWRRLRVEEVKAILADPSIARLPEARREVEIANRLLLCCEDELPEQARPSVESHLHALLGRVVIHLHPIVVAAFVSAKRGEEALHRLFDTEELPLLWVPYADPGYMLARLTARLIGRYQRHHRRPPQVLFLEKHGVFVTAETAKDALALVRQAITRCQSVLPRPLAAKPPRPREAEVTAGRLAIRAALREATGEYVCAAHFLDQEIASLMARRDIGRLSSLPPLAPDEIVYANGSPMWLESWRRETIVAKLKRQLAAGGKPAHAFLVKGLGLIAAGPPRALHLVRDIAVASLRVRGYAERFGGAHPLTKRQRAFIAEWEAESYRRSVAAGVCACPPKPCPTAGRRPWRRREGELAGQIAIVTGSGSGLGRSIARGLAQAGAVVALADIDEPAAQETAGLIAADTACRAGLPRPAETGVAMPLLCDVTSEESADAAFGRLLGQWGGLDILVNAAGIAPPYALVDLPAAKWRAALEVNLTGYFLMAQRAAQIMIQQGIGGNIIAISSKSGLEASRENTAYNATKAAEIHMARGWALELGEHGIRVNSVAPGNVFEGSRIWNPKYIRVCAEKYGIRPDQVVDYYVSKTALKRDIKGFDVANAVIFLCSDRARTITGQTLVADGGQVMVR